MGVCVGVYGGVKHEAKGGNASNLQVVEWIHFHHRADGVEREGDVDALTGHQWSVDRERCGGDHAKTKHNKTGAHGHYLHTSLISKPSILM